MYNLSYVYSNFTYIEVLLLEELLNNCCLDTVYIVQTNVGLYREVATEGGVGSISLSEVLSCDGTIGVAIWGRDLGTVGANGEET